jgi:hypothetical protein
MDHPLNVGDIALNVGDSAMYTTSLGQSYSVIIVGILETGGYICQRDGAYSDSSCSHPNLTVYDGHTPLLRELKNPFEFSGHGWSSLKPRLREQGDDERRKEWNSRLKKYEEEIAAHWLSYAHIKVGFDVECYDWTPWTGQRNLEFVGTVTFIYSNYTCYVIDKKGNERKYRLGQLRVITPITAPFENA